jgi:hypothetical protein
MNFTRKKLALSLLALLVIGGVVVAIILISSNHKSTTTVSQTSAATSAVTDVSFSTTNDLQALPEYINEKIGLKGDISGVNGTYYILSGKTSGSGSVQLDFSKSGLSSKQIAAHSNNLKTYTVIGKLITITANNRRMIELDVQSIQ